MSTARPVEDAVIQGIRRDLESRGFTYRARKLWRKRPSWTIQVEIERPKWVAEGMFDVAVEFEFSGQTVAAYRILLSQCAGRRMPYGSTLKRLKPTEVMPDEVLDDFRHLLLPIIEHNDSPETLAESFLGPDLAPEVRNPQPELDRLGEAYLWGVATDRSDIAAAAVARLRELAGDARQRDDVLFAWKMLDIPEAP